MTKITSLPICDRPSQLRTEHVDGAWQLAYTALWLHDKIPPPDIKYSQQIIRRTMAGSTELKPSFVHFCERILLANRLLQTVPAQWIDVPSIWFHPDFANGFVGTQSLHRLYVMHRQTIPEYQQGIATFAVAYWDYINQPGPAILKDCHRKLLRLREYGLLQLWNNLIMLHQSK